MQVFQRCKRYNSGRYTAELSLYEVVEWGHLIKNMMLF